MSDLSTIEIRKLEKALGMSSGYVLNFSNRTFSEFILDSTGIDIYSEKYNSGSGSKACRLREFFKIESNYIVGKLLSDILNCWKELSTSFSPGNPPDDYLKIVQRIKQGAPVPDIDSILPFSGEQAFESIAKSVRESIERNEPECGLDRLHTYVMKYFRVLCENHGISIDKGKPLHSLVGEYLKDLRLKGLIESEMTERILKSSISVMEAFNKVRNDQSLAHDNKILNYNESLLIFGHVTSSIKFINSIELNLSTPTKRPEISDDLPF